jgi:hypothetical protein
LAVEHLDVAGQHLGRQCQSGIGDRDRDPPLVIGGGSTRDQAGLLEEPGLTGQTIAAVDDAVSQVGHVTNLTVLQILSTCFDLEALLPSNQCFEFEAQTR